MATDGHAGTPHHFCRACTHPVSGPDDTSGDGEPSADDRGGESSADDRAAEPFADGRGGESSADDRAGESAPGGEGGDRAPDRDGGGGAHSTDADVPNDGDGETPVRYYDTVPRPDAPRATQRHLAHALSTAMLAGPWTRDEMLARCAQSIGLTASPVWIERVVDGVLGIFGDPPRDSPRLLRDLVLVTPGWRVGDDARVEARLEPRRRRRPKGLRAPADRLRPTYWQPGPTAMGPTRWPVLRLDTVAGLAALLDVDTAELAWFADVQGRERRATSSPLRHYRVAVRAKPGGIRILEIPKPRLREIQRRLLRHVLAPIPTHPAAHGCVVGHSVATAVAPHAGHGTVVRADLEAFFASIAAGRIYGILRAAGYPEPVAHLVTGLCTTRLSQSSWREIPGTGDAHRRLGRSLALAHLPQGAPTSPALANLAAFHLDKRLAGLAVSFGATYTRYVDDLVFSGPSVRGGRLLTAVSDLAADEGFRLAARKSVVLSRAGRQQILGAVINDKVGVARRDLDRLRAILHNCAVTGWAEQARGHTGEQFRAHLAGRVAWVNSLDPAHGGRLQAQFAAIDWSTV